MEAKDHHQAEKPSTNGQHGEGYSGVLDALGIPYRLNGPWLVYGQPDYDDRWVICLSLRLIDAEPILHVLLPILHEREIPFLLIKDRLQHNRINNHAFPTPLFGKALQVFPRTTGGGVDLARRLRAITDPVESVRIPGAIRLGSIVYAVYATKNPDFDPETDHSLPFRFGVDVPGEVGNPFPADIIVESKTPGRLLKKRYLPVSLIRSSHKGNILKGLDLYTLRWVFIKQANAWAGEDFHERTMRDRLLWQQEVAEAVGEWVRTPKPLDFIEQDGFSYFITEFIDGQTLESFIVSQGKRDSFAFLFGCYHETLLLVQNLHRLGYVHRDLTARNLLVRDGHVYLTDFELAHRLGDDTPPFAGGTKGYVSPEQRRNQPPGTKEDVYTLGALLHYIVYGGNPERILPQHIQGMAGPLAQAIEGCMQSIVEDRWPLEQLVHSIRPLLPDARRRRRIRLGLLWKATKPKLALTGLLAMLATATVVGLWLASDEPNSRNNGFTRSYVTDGVKTIREYAVPEDVRYFAGRIGDSLYFSTLTPGELLILQAHGGAFHRRHLLNDPTLRSRLGNSNILEANRFGLTLFDGNNRLIIAKNDGIISYRYVSEIFSRAVRISANSIALRKFKPGVRDQYLYRFDLARDTALDETQVTAPSTDGGLVTGGILAFDPENGQGVYVTRYANRVAVLDTNMRITATGHTLDTFYHYKIKSETIALKHRSKVTNAGPAHYINKAATLSGGVLFVNSYAKADNETADAFRGINAVDVYEIGYPGEAPAYRGSYALPTANQARIRNMRAYGNTLAVLIPGKFTLYHLTL